MGNKDTDDEGVKLQRNGIDVGAVAGRKFGDLSGQLPNA